jgi:hypothetical protein
VGDFHLFPELKQNLGGHKSKDDHEVGKVVVQCLVTQAADWYEQGIGKLILLYNKYLTRDGDYVEK